jgi:hypothetical protein
MAAAVDEYAGEGCPSGPQRTEVLLLLFLVVVVVVVGVLVVASREA